uniref:Target of rapamycin complex subunit lst8 n=1 Tax=Electrophorus electricus TaxID=8005 RepID=A0A4W4F1J2_ELEEL
MNVNQGTVGSDPVILATAGYDHTVRFWQAHSGICTRTVQHQDSQVNSLEVTPDRSMIAAAEFFHLLCITSQFLPFHLHLSSLKIGDWATV